MKKLINQLFKETTVYGLSGMVSSAIGLLLVPLYTRVLSPADYGVLYLIDTGIFFIVILTGLALDNSATRWYFDSEDASVRKQTISTWLTFVVATTSVFSILLVIFAKPIATQLLETTETKYVLIPAITVLATRVPTVISTLFRLRRKPWHAFVFAISLSLLTIGLNVYLILYLKWGILGILTANLTANTIATIVLIFAMPGWLTFRHFNFKLVKPMLLFALPLVPTAVSFWLLNGASSYFINNYSTKTETGLFATGFKFAAGLNLLIAAFQSAWPAFAYSIQEKDEAKRVYAFVFTIYCLGFSFLALGLALFSKEILIIFTQPTYYDAAFVMGLLCFNAIIYGPASILSIGLAIKKQTKPMAKAILIGSAITFGLYFVFVPTMGKEGAVISTMLGYLTITVLIAIYNQRVNPIPFNFVMGGGSFLLAIALFLLQSFVFNTDSMGLNISIKCLLLLVYLLVCVRLINKFYPNRINQFISKIRKRGVAE